MLSTPLSSVLMTSTSAWWPTTARSLPCRSARACRSCARRSSADRCLTDGPSTLLTRRPKWRSFRTEAKPFTDRQLALLQTFADQTVIAIETVRLFKELDARNKDLTVALE